MPFFEVTVTTVHTYCVESDTDAEALEVGMEEHTFDPNAEAEATLLKESEVESAKRHCDKFYPMPK